MAGGGSAAVRERLVTGFDGTVLACRETGLGPTLMLANGLGGTWTAWRHLIDYFRDRFHIVSWDYRGLYRSGPSATPGLFDMATHVRDAIAVADALGVDDAVWIGWSMGVQLDFEIVRRHPERVRGLVAVNGTYGKPFDTAFGRLGSRRLIRAAAEIARRNPRLVSGVVGHAAAWDGLVGALKRLRLVGRTLDETVFRDLARDFGSLDPVAYFSTFGALGEHDASDALPSIRCPVLIVAGDRDPMTPRDLSDRMARMIPGADLLIVPGGTHYVPIEYPELMNLRLEKFLRDRLPSGTAERAPAGGMHPGAAADA